MGLPKLKLSRLNQASRIVGTSVLAAFGSIFVGSAASPSTTIDATSAPSIPERVKAVRRKIMLQAKGADWSLDAKFRVTQFFNFPNFSNAAKPIPKSSDGTKSSNSPKPSDTSPNAN
jgi:hypothetical protein